MVECLVHHNIQWSFLGFVKSLAQIDAQNAEYADDDPTYEIGGNQQAGPTDNGRAVQQGVQQNIQTGRKR